MNKQFLHTVLRKFIPNIGTLLLGALLFFAYRAWAAPSVAPETPHDVITAPQAVPAAQEATPGTLSYQGKLKTTAGQDVNGNIDMGVFHLS